MRALVVVLLALLVGCSRTADSTSGAGACTRADPTCPAIVPSYANEIAPIFTAACVPCHYAGNPYAQSNLVDYANVHRVYGSALGQVESCLMPPASVQQLSEAERTAVLAWLACGAPDN